MIQHKPDISLAAKTGHFHLLTTGVSQRDQSAVVGEVVSERRGLTIASRLPKEKGGQRVEFHFGMGTVLRSGGPEIGCRRGAGLGFKLLAMG